MCVYVCVCMLDHLNAYVYAHFTFMCKSVCVLYVYLLCSNYRGDRGFNPPVQFSTHPVMVFSRPLGVSFKPPPPPVTQYLMKL